MKVNWFYVGQDIQIQISDEFKNELNTSGHIGDLFDELNDLVTADEINPHSGEHWLANENNLFSMAINDYKQLLDKGVCRVYNIGTIDENVNMNVENDRDFHNWYYNKNN